MHSSLLRTYLGLQQRLEARGAPQLMNSFLECGCAWLVSEGYEARVVGLVGLVGCSPLYDPSALDSTSDVVATLGCLDQGNAGADVSRSVHFPRRVYLCLGQHHFVHSFRLPLRCL